MQIADNKGAEPSDFVGGFEEVRHHDRHHACRDADRTPLWGLQAPNMLWLHAEPLSGFERIGRGLSLS